MKKLLKYYWDTSVFLMILGKQETYGAETLAAAIEIFRKAELGEAVIVSSEIVVAEVLPCNQTVEAYDLWESCLQWENIVLRAADHAVTSRAAILRSDCLQQKPNPVKIKTPDALHVATFLIYENEIDHLHSVDGDFSKTLKWSGSARVATVPRRPQPTLDFKEDPTNILSTPSDLGKKPMYRLLTKRKRVSADK